MPLVLTLEVNQCNLEEFKQEMMDPELWQKIMKSMGISISVANVSLNELTQEEGKEGGE